MPNMNMDLEKKLRLWAQDTLDNIRRNFAVQKVFPFEVRPGYLEYNKNVKRGWKSTGAAYDSFVAQIRDAAPDHLRMDFLYRYYMNFVDIGTGPGRPAERVQRNTAAQNTRRYTEWVPKEGKTHRPVTSMEFRHLARRMTRYMVRRYELEGSAAVLNAFGVELETPENTVVIMKENLTKK